MTFAHRQAEVLVRVRQPDGSPAANAEVTVRQCDHAFGFGNIGFDFVAPPDAPAEEQLAQLWLDVFNLATLPFYWARFEPRRGAPDTAGMLATARWFREHGVRLKGHPLVWHTLAPGWLRALPDDEVEALVRARVRRDVSAFAGLVTNWDAINEAVIMPVFDNEEAENAITRLCRRLGRVPTVRLAFEEARAADPQATLVLNDFDMSADYERLVEEVLAAGVRVDALGLQSHMHQGYWGEERTLEVLERFARFGLPLHLTESTLLSGDLMPPEIVDLNDYQPDHWPSTPEGEGRQADELVRHYRTLLGHPAVEVVTYWGLTDRGAWLGAPAGLVRADGTPKPAYDALRRLVKEEWWLAPATLRTDDEGRVRVRGWHGEYAVARGAAEATFHLGPDPAAEREVGEVTVTLPG